MRAVYHARRDIRIEEIADPEPGPDEVLLDVDHRADRHVKMFVDPSR